MFSSILYLGGAWLVVVLITPLLIRAAERSGFGLDHQNDFRKIHDGRICRLGGIPVFVALVLAILVARLLHGLELGENDTAILVGMTLMFGLGLWDDFQPLGARVKLLGQITIAILMVNMGLCVDTLTYPGGNFAINIGFLGTIMTVVWLIVVPNMINLIDGTDGLASGIGMFLAATLGVVAIISQQWGVAALSFAMTGALLGFLYFNFPPAKIFLGDGGAYLVGFSIAALSVESQNKGSVAAALLVTFIALGLPILDTTLTILRRAVQGFPLFHADRGHIHHRLFRLGLSKRRVLISLYAVCVTLSLVGLSIFWSQGRTLPIAAGVLVTLAFFALRYLGYLDQRDGLSGRVRYGLDRRREVRYALLQSRVLEMEVDRCRSADDFWEVFFATLARMDMTRERSGNGDAHATTLRGDGVELTIHTPVGLHSHDYAERIAALFAPSFLRALKRWPDTLPPGANSVPTATDSPDIEPAAAPQ